MPKRYPGLIILLVTALVSNAEVLAQQAPRNAVMQDCEDLDFSIKREASPYHYTNPNEGCDISLSLDGLPKKTGSGYSSSGNDACRTIQGVVSNLEGRLNERLEGALGAIGEVVSPEDLAQFGEQTGVDMSGISDALENGISFDRTLNNDLTNTPGQLATEEGRSQLADDLKSGAGDAARNSLDQSRQNVSTPGINGGQGTSTESSDDWSIFD